MCAFSFQTSIDILTTVVRNTKPPLSQLLICQAFPAVAQCSLHTDDNATMQVTSIGKGQGTAGSCHSKAMGDTSQSLDMHYLVFKVSFCFGRAQSDPTSSHAGSVPEA